MWVSEWIPIAEGLGIARGSGIEDCQNVNCPLETNNKETIAILAILNSGATGNPKSFSYGNPVTHMRKTESLFPHKVRGIKNMSSKSKTKHIV